MEGVLGLFLGLCAFTWVLAYLIGCAVTGAEFILKCASELGFIGVIAFWVAWILFFPAMLSASIICGFLMQ